MRVRENLKRGTVEMIILHLLQERDKYGYELCQEMRELSGGRFSVTESSMYPILYRLIASGILTDRQEIVGRRRVRVYYHLEEEGYAYLKELKAEYDATCKSIAKILNSNKTKKSADKE